METKREQALARFPGEVLEAISDFCTEVVEVRDVGDVTLAELRNRGRGAGSDTPEDRLVGPTRLKPKALEALGRSEQDAPADS